MPTIKKLLLWLLAAFLIYAIITNPDRAADIVRSAWEIIFQGVVNIGRFFHQLING